MGRYRSVFCPNCNRSHLVDHYGEDDRDNYLEFYCQCGEHLYFYNSKEYGIRKRYLKYIRISSNSINFEKCKTFDINLINNVVKIDDKFADEVMVEDVTEDINISVIRQYLELSNYDTIKNKLKNRIYGDIEEKEDFISNNNLQFYTKYYGREELSFIYINNNNIIIELEYDCELDILDIIKEIMS